MFIAVLLVVIRKETYTLMRKESDNFAFQRIQTFKRVLMDLAVNWQLAKKIVVNWYLARKLVVNWKMKSLS